MATQPKRLPPSYGKVRRQLDEALFAVRSSDPALYAEHMAVMTAMAQRAEQWRAEPNRLPQGVEVVPMTDDDGCLVHAIEWGRSPPPAPPIAFHDRAVAVQLTWMVFMLRRPWAIDDGRLRALVEQPPTTHAIILGNLLSIRFAVWIRQAYAALTEVCTDNPPPEHGVEALEELFQSLAASTERYDARATVAIHELAGLFEVVEPDAGVGHEFARWQWMLDDYLRAWDPQLHQRVRALEGRHGVDKRDGVAEAWEELLHRRQLDACTGLLLARAAMLAPQRQTSALVSFVDPMSTRAAGSFGWWCRLVLDAWEDEYPLGDRLQTSEIASFMGFARQEMERLDGGLLEALVRAFPVLG